MPIVAKLGTQYGIAVAAGYLAAVAGVPLAWMIGPMLATAALAVAGWAVAVPLATRMAGQTVVASAVGLYFTPDSLAELISQAPYMVGAALGTIAAGVVTAALLARLARTEPATALFASVPGGPVEMAIMAEQAGGDGAAVAIAQTLRIAAIVLIIPPALLWFRDAGSIGTLGTDAEVTRALPFLLLLVVAAGFTFRRLRIVNPFFLGPLAASALLTAGDIHLSGIPAPLLATGQVLLGVSLGIRFDQALLRRAPRFLAATALTTALLLGCCLALAWAISSLSGHALPEAILATAPGSVTEMALTAKGLNFGVASVTAFHIVRIFIIVPLSPLMLRALLQRNRKGASVKPGLADE